MSNLDIYTILLPEPTIAMYFILGFAATTFQFTFVSGWGRTVGGGSTAQILQEAVMPVISSSVCNAQSQEERLPTVSFLFHSVNVDSLYI